MIKKITLENFMSHIRTELELASGLTVLVGPNNCGKSAVVEAIRTVCENSGKDFMVRHGEKFCRVTIETDDGHIIEWKRDKAVVSYTIDGRDIHRLNGSVPDDLHELLRLPLVASPDGKDEFDIHIARQKSPLFLLERTGREAAMFFASSSDAALVMDMQRRHKTRVTDRRREQIQLIKKQQLLKSQLQSLDPIAQVDESLRAAEVMHVQIQSDEAIAERCATQLNAMDQQVGIVKQLQDRAAVLHTLPALPAFTDTQPLEKMLNDLAQSQVAVSHGQDLLRQLVKLTAPPPLDETIVLEAFCRELREVAVQVAAGQDRIRAARSLAEPPVLDDFAPLTALCSAIDHQSRICDRLGSGTKLLARLSAPPEQHAAEILNAMSSTITGLKIATDVVAQRSADLQSATSATHEALAAIRKWAADHPTCPVCGGVVDADDLLLVGGHEHG